MSTSAGASGPQALDLGYAVIDLDREDRQGLPEVVYGPGKSSSQIAGIVAALLQRSSGPVIVTRVASEVARRAAAEIGDVGHHDEAARLLFWRPKAVGRDAIRIAIVSAGTADRPVAQEAASICAVLGHGVVIVEDVGVAGLHRLLRRIDDIRSADIVIVVAGMEAALSSVVGGLVAVPVVAVPASTGYGAALEGVTALLGMLSGCAAGVTVVGIDNGFGAALAAHRLSQAMRRYASAAQPHMPATGRSMVQGRP